MAKKHVIKDDTTETVSVNHGNGIWILDQGVSVDVAAGWGLHNANNNNVDFVIKGQVGSDGTTSVGVFDTGRNTRVEVTDTGTVEAWQAFLSNGANMTILNEGYIVGGVSAFDLDGKNFFVRNSGIVTAEAGDRRVFLLESAVSDVLG